MQAVKELAPAVGTAPACEAIGVARATFYRNRSPRPTPKPRPIPERALSHEDREEVLATLHSERFVDVAPAEVFGRS